MDKLKLAIRLSFGYKKKTIGTFIFATFTLSVIFLGVNLLLNTFNGWANEQMGFLFPNYFVNSYPEFDIRKRNVGFEELMISKNDQDKLHSLFSDKYDIYEGIYLLGNLYEKGFQEKSQNVFVVGIDFQKARDIFPTFKERFTQEEMDSFSKSRSIIFEKTFAEDSGFSKGKDFIFITNNYDGVVNAIKLEATAIIDLELPETNSAANIPLVYINISALDMISGAPDNISFPVLLRSKLPQDVVGFKASSEDSRLQKLLSSTSMISYNPVHFAKSYSNTFNLYKLVFILLGCVLLLVVIVSVSSNLFILFQQRKKDFGVFKALGYNNKDISFLLFGENIVSLFLSSLLAILIHFILTKMTGDFYLVNLPSNLEINPASLQVLMLLVLGLSLITIFRPLRYVLTINPINILKEE